MNAPASSPAPETPVGPAAPGFDPAVTDASCRVPVTLMFVSAAVWLLVGSVFALLSSIKFHSPEFLAGPAWLTYGRVRPAFLNSWLYGFAVQAGLGVTLWFFSRLGRIALQAGGIALAGAVFWNLGVTAGVAGILGGDSTGFQLLDMPLYAAILVFSGYFLIGISAALTLRARRERGLFVTQWFLFAALFWFPWIYSTAYTLLVIFPVRGVTQAVLGWWYSENLLVVWLGLVGLGSVFYLVPKLGGRDLHSHYLALLAFWALVLFASWGGIPGTAPVPAWMPAISTVATVLVLPGIVAVPLNVYRSLGRVALRVSGSPALSFVLVGVAAFVLAGLMQICRALADPTGLLGLSWFVAGRELLQLYGFFALVMFGAIYFILPRLTGAEFISPKLVQLHFWLALAGTVVGFLPLVIGGVIQTLELENWRVPFMQIQNSMLMFLRVSTIGDLLLLAGHVVFAVNLARLAVRYYRARAAAAYSVATEDLFRIAEAKS